MATLIAEGMCCCFALCCKDISEALKRWLGPERVTKVFYLFLVIVITVPAIAIMFYLNEWSSFRSYFSWLSCPASSGGYLCWYEGATSALVRRRSTGYL